MHDPLMRAEVLDFLLVSEVLLSPVLCPPDFTEEECCLIAEFIVKLSTCDYPWSHLLPVRYPSDKAELDPVTRQCDRLRRLLTEDPSFSAQFDTWMVSRE